LYNVRCEARRHYRKKKAGRLKHKINELAKNSESKNKGELYKGINELKTGYQQMTNLVKDENGDLLVPLHFK
jgi:hypothetical protein